jgi:hypothetical protein
MCAAGSRARGYQIERLRKNGSMATTTTFLSFLALLHSAQFLIVDRAHSGETLIVVVIQTITDGENNFWNLSLR